MWQYDKKLAFPVKIKCTKNKNGNGESTQKIYNSAKYIDKKLLFVYNKFVLQKNVRQ